MAESFSEVDSRSIRLGAGRAARCHLLSLMGAAVGMLPSVCSRCANQGRGEQDLELGAVQLPALPLATSLTPTLERWFCGKVHLA